MRAHSPQVRGAAIARLLAGASLHAVARETGLDRKTLRGWLRDFAATGDHPPLKKTGASDEALGEQVRDWAVEGLGTLRAQLGQFGDPAWLAQQSAGDLARLHGRMFDGLARGLAARPPEDRAG